MGRPLATGAGNLFGSCNFAATVLPQMHAGAHFVLTASLAGKIGNFAYGDYCASKYATVDLAEVLRIEQYLRVGVMPGRGGNAAGNRRAPPHASGDP